MKTQTQHTLGPWATSSAWNIMKGGTKIATLEQMPGNYECERMANAQLISAAPDLLDALRFLLSDYIAIQGDKITKSSVPIEMAQAAILKAEGKQ